MNVAKKGTIVSVKKISTRTVEVAIKVAMDFEFIAGQYIWLMIPQLKYKDPRGNTRMFSIASSPNKKGELEIIFRNSNSGYKKTLIEMAPGAEITFSGPYGSLRLPENKYQPIVIVAGGVGVAPFLSIIRFACESHSSHNITLLHVNANRQDTVYSKELTSLEKNNSKLKIVRLFGHLRGASLQQFISSAQLWYVTGPKAFVDLANKILNNAGVSDSDMVFEEFYPSSDTERTLQRRLKAAGPNNPFFLAVENTSNHVIITDTNGVILYANKRAENVTGYSFEEMKGNTPRLWGGLMPEKFYKDFWQLKKYQKQSYIGEIKNRRKNQDEYFAYMNTSPILDGDSLIGYISTEEDITHQKEVNQDLIDSNTAALNVLEDLNTEKSKVETAKAKEEAILLSIGDGLIATDEHGKILLINQMAEILLKQKSADVEGKAFSDAIVAEDEKGAVIPLEKRPVSLALATGVTTTTSIITGPITYYLRNDKTKFPVAVAVAPVILEGKLIGAIEVFRDVSHEREIDKAKTEFVSMTSHQLRTPLTAISWYTEMILGGDVGVVTPTQKKYLDEIYQGNKRMIELVDTLLDVSRIELGRLAVSLKETDVVEIAQNLLNEEKHLIEEKKLAFTQNFSKDMAKIMTDPKLLRMIFQNLVVNSVKYTPPEGKIEFSISADDKKNILIKVSDTGYGIPENQKSKIFNKLFRADNVADKDPGGTGLGLYITKSIVDNFKGKIWFESKENQGTTFYVSLPIVTPGVAVAK